MDASFVAWLMVPGDAPDTATVLAGLVNRPSWHQWAACRGVGAARFVIAHGAQYDGGQRQLCASCPVREQCLETALGDPDLVGLWGSTTQTERRAMRRPKAAPVHVSERRATERGEIFDDEDELDRTELERRRERVAQ